MAAAEVLAGEVAPILLSELRSRLEAALQVEAKLRALVSLFRSRDEVAGYAEPVENAINSVRRSAGVQREDDWAIGYWAGAADRPSARARTMMGSRGSAPVVPPSSQETRLQLLAMLVELVQLLRTVDIQASLVELRDRMAAIGPAEAALAAREASGH
jgi:hypothetical protein